MFNFISTENKKVVKKEYSYRFFSIFLFFFGLVAFLGAVSLFPSYKLLGAKEKNLNINSRVLEESANLKEAEKYKQILNESQKQEVAFGVNKESVDLTDLVLEILSKKNSGIKINSLRLDDGDVVHFNISGVATKREFLANFVDKIKSSEKFSNINLPISNLAKSENAIFSVSLEFKRSLDKARDK